MKRLPIVLIYCLLLLYSCGTSDDADTITMEEEEEEVEETTSLYFPPIDSNLWETSSKSVEQFYGTYIVFKIYRLLYFRHSFDTLSKSAFQWL